MRTSRSPRPIAAIAFAGALAALLVSAPATAQQPGLADSLLDRMAGRWVLRGTIAGRQTTHDVQADWVLAHGYVRLQEVARERDARGAPAYEAIVFIGRDPTRAGYACLWLDSTGDTGLDPRAFGHADPARGDSIAFVFGAPDGTLVHTTFVYERARDRWRWNMDGESRTGTRESFARVTLTRESAPVR